LFCEAFFGQRFEPRPFGLGGLSLDPLNDRDGAAHVPGLYQISKDVVADDQE
jgi:hypothetical protein